LLKNFDFVIPNEVCEVRNLSFLGSLIEEGFLASLGMTAKGILQQPLKGKPAFLRANPNHCHEAPGEAGFAAMAEEEFRAASGAEVAGKNVSRVESGGEELRAVGFGKIEVNIARRWLVAGGRHVEPLQRIGFIAGAWLIEIFGRISELRGELADEFGADFVTTGADGWSDSSEEISRLAAEFEVHPANGFFGDARERALPTRMNGGDSAFFGIYQKDGNAIGGLHREKHAGAIGGGGVTLARVRGRGVEKMNRVGVNLLERCERESLGGESSLQQAAVLGDVFARVPFHETEIQNLLAIESADAAGTRAESMHQPGKFAQGREL
jgi:hypothetical protein